MTRKTYSLDIIRISLSKCKKCSVYLAKKYYIYDNLQGLKVAFY